MGNEGARPSGPKCIALIGPYLSGKTTLLESILARTGTVNRQGKVSDGNTIGDASPEARAHGMSVELNVASIEYHDDRYTFIDCPGSVEFLQEQIPALPAVDAAIVVCEPDDKKIPALQLILKQLDQLGIPRILFLNKVDKTEMRVRDILNILQPASEIPLVLRQIPIWEDNVVTGCVDLALERAFIYRKHAQSEVVDLPDGVLDRKGEARYSMLEQLADYDDELMEALLEDIEPTKDTVFGDLAQELAQGQICPVLLGSAENGNGIRRLLKAIRHEVPTVEATVERLSMEGEASVGQILKTYHTTHGGKLSLVRLMSGQLKDGTILYGEDGKNERVSGIFTLLGQEPTKVAGAVAGDTVALGRMESFRTGETISDVKGDCDQAAPLESLAPVYGLAISAVERNDEVKLTGAIAKIMEEDPSIKLKHAQDTNEMVIWGQGEMHLRVALERLEGKYGIAAQTRRRKIPYKETIRKSITVRGRHKKQSGGHGQFGDVVVDIKPLPRGSGFDFSQTITGGVVPKQYIPAVEHGIEEYLAQGPLGFPVVDLAAKLTDGSYHAVDSSEQAFKTAGRIAMSEGLPQCSPVLLEPVLSVAFYIPSDATARINAIISTRRGQILGFDARPGWMGWDVVNAHLPEIEIQDIIVEVRSATAGVGTFTFEFDHLSELTGKLAEQVLSDSKAQAA
jgi:elongation factor G